MQKLGNPLPVFLDFSGALIDGGKIYVGVADADPETDPVEVFWDSALTIPADQPLRTIGGLIVNGVIPSAAFIAETDYSMRLRDDNDVQVFYSPSVYGVASGFQPLNSNLTAISALTTTAYGRALLTLANQAALVTATGIPVPVPLAGSTGILGDLGRNAGGYYTYWDDAAMINGQQFITASADPDPRTAGAPGQVWMKYV